MKSVIPREVESLWTLFTAPIVWAVHFVVCYGAVAVYCAKASMLGFDFATMRMVLGGFTVVALGLIVFSAYLAWRQWGFGSGDPPHDEATRQDRALFQGFATLLLSGLSFVAVVYVAIPLIFIAECQR